MMHHPAPSSPLNLNLEASSSPPPPPSSSSSPVSARRRWSWLGRGLPCFAIGALLLAFVFLFQFSGLELSMDLQHMKDWLMAKQTKDSDSADPSPRIAICLVGGAREFELTGPSIRKYLLNQDLLPQADVFLHSPLDKDTYKLSLLAGGDLRAINLVHFRIIKPEPILESKTYTDVLTGSGSPHGVQGLLQYFNLVEGCANMIKGHQQQHNFTYEWIIRTRLDGYWNGYLPSLDKMDRNAYNVPIGSQYGGLNDRLGIGNWETSEVALARLSLLPLIHEHGAKGLNSESSFKQQLEVKGVPYKFFEFPFCIVSRRKYGWPPGVPVASISSKGPLNGAKCRPCDPISNGTEAMSIIQGLDRGHGWIGNVEEIELCNATVDWEPNWRDVYHNVFVSLNQSVSECIQANEELRKEVQLWDAPIAKVICEVGLRP